MGFISLRHNRRPRSTDSCTQTPSPTYSPRCQYQANRRAGAARGVSYRGVCFTAGAGLWGGAGGFGDGLPGRSRPRRLWPGRHQGCRDVADQSGVRAGNSEGEADARCHLDDTGTKLQEPQANGGELGGGKRVCLGDCITQGEHQPVRGGVQDEPHLVGERAAAAGAIGGKLRLVQFDEVLGLASGAVERFVDMLGRPGLDAGDDEADVEALCGGLDPGAGAAVSVPGFRPIACLGEAAQAGLLVERAAGANVVGGLIDQPVEHAVAREAKDEVEVVLVAPFQNLRAAVMTVASDRDPGLRPVPADATDETAQVTAGLDARGRLAGAAEARG